MTAEEKLALIDWCRNETAVSVLAGRKHPLKLVRQPQTTALRAIWRPVAIADHSYSLCADLRSNGELDSLTFRNLGTNASLHLTRDGSATRLQAISKVTRMATA